MNDPWINEFGDGWKPFYNNWLAYNPGKTEQECWDALNTVTGGGEPVNERPFEENTVTLEEVQEPTTVDKDSEAKAQAPDTKNVRVNEKLKPEAKIGIKGEWLKSLEKDKKGCYKSTTDNLLIIFENDQNIKDLLSLDSFIYRQKMVRVPFWRTEDNVSLLFTDADEAEMRIYLETSYGMVVGKDRLRDIILAIGTRNAYHPVREYLKTLKWDGKPRIEAFFIDVLGADDDKDGLTRMCSRKMLIGGVNRIFEPGCQMDYTMTFVGDEGQGKSMLLSKLAIKDEWFTDHFTIDGKEAVENLQGKFICEIGELVALKKSDSAAIKNFLTRKSDYCRAAYAHNPENRPRQCIFFGTGNDIHFLKGEGGDRRFWPVTINPADKKRNWNTVTDEEVNQLWAEAKYYYEQGERPYLSPEMEELMRQRQQGHREEDDRAGLISEYLDRPIPTNWDDKSILDKRSFFYGTSYEIGTKQRVRVSVAEIWNECLGKDLSEMDRHKTKPIHNIMKNMKDWEVGKSQVTIKGYGSQTVYRRK